MNLFNDCFFCKKIINYDSLIVYHMNENYENENDEEAQNLLNNNNTASIPLLFEGLTNENLVNYSFEDKDPDRLGIVQKNTKLNMFVNRVRRAQPTRCGAILKRCCHCCCNCLSSMCNAIRNCFSE